MVGSVTLKDKTNVKKKKTLSLNIKATNLDEKESQLFQDPLAEKSQQPEVDAWSTCGESKASMHNTSTKAQGLH